MIKAAVYCAEWDKSPNSFRLTHPGDPPPQPPKAYKEWLDFRRYGLPPNAGGMRDQPLGWFEICGGFERAYRTWSAWIHSDKGPAWCSAHPEEARAARQLREVVYGQ